MKPIKTIVIGLLLFCATVVLAHKLSGSYNRDVVDNHVMALKFIAKSINVFQCGKRGVFCKSVTGIHKYQREGNTITDKYGIVANYDPKADVVTVVVPAKWAGVYKSKPFF